jgi:hypothetical protein
MAKIPEENQVSTSVTLESALAVISTIKEKELLDDIKIKTTYFEKIPHQT